LHLSYGHTTGNDLKYLSWRSSTAEQLICNQQVAGSNPIASSQFTDFNFFKMLSGPHIVPTFEKTPPEKKKSPDCSEPFSSPAIKITVCAVCIPVAGDYSVSL
jgi:hypothetical protein